MHKQTVSFIPACHRGKSARTKLHINPNNAVLSVTARQRALALP
jgi:hypothetical protein